VRFSLVAELVHLNALLQTRKHAEESDSEIKTDSYHITSEGISRTLRIPVSIFFNSEGEECLWV
jgi:hypothetical protein